MSAYLDTVLLRKLLGVLLTPLRTGSVSDGNISTHLGAATGGFDAHALRAGGTGYDDDLGDKCQENAIVGEEEGGGKCTFPFKEKRSFR